MQCPNCGYEFEGGQRCPACDTQLGQVESHRREQGNRQAGQPQQRQSQQGDQPQQPRRSQQGDQPQQPRRSQQGGQQAPPQSRGQHPQGPPGGGPPERGGDDGIDRRTLMIGGAGALVVAGGGWYFFLRGDDPESAVETYFDAIADGDAERAEAIIHPDSGLYAYVYEDGADQIDIEIHEVDERSVREALREQWNVEGEELDDEVERTRENLEDLVDEHELDDYAYVYYDATFDDERYDEYEIDGYILTVEDGGDWYVWGGY